MPSLLSSNPSHAATAPLVDLQGITVRFGPVLANDQVDFAVRRGEVVALLGENGAGKSTLMKVLAGLVRPQAGQIRLAGQPVQFESAIHATELGIGMVHQHFMLIPTLTVVQNVCIGLHRTGYPFPNLRRVSRELSELAAAHHLQIDPSAPVGQLSVGQQQRVEIVKALYRGAELLILDEPTAVLTPQETEGLFRVVRSLAQQGKAIIFISHKLNEVTAISDRVYVMRQGRMVAERATAQTDAAELAQLMVGRDIHLPQTGERTATSVTAAPVLDVSKLHYTDKRGVAILQGIDLTVQPGEIHGIAGVDGNGQTEFIHLLAGLLTPTAGSIRVDGRDITHTLPGPRIAAGMAHIPADRQHVGLVLDLSIADNSLLAEHATPRFARHGLLNRRAARRFGEELMTTFDIRAHSVSQKVGTLSGGNQQKVVLARELSRTPRLILANQPTRGLDVGAIEYVYTQLLAQRAAGSAILLVSTELEEIMTLCDRISVMYEGKLMASMPRSEATRERLGLLMAGRHA